MITIKLPDLSGSISINEVGSIGEGIRGVYVLRDEFGDCLYVGQSVSIRQRVMTHIRDSLFRAYIDTIDYYVIPDGFQREICETVFINRLVPKYNRAKVFESDDEEYERLYYEINQLEDRREALREERQELRDYFRRNPYEELGDYTDTDEGLAYLLGEELRNVDRLKQVESEIQSVSSGVRRRRYLIRR